MELLDPCFILELGYFIELFAYTVVACLYSDPRWSWLALISVQFNNEADSSFESGLNPLLAEHNFSVQHLTIA